MTNEQIGMLGAIISGCLIVALLAVLGIMADSMGAVRLAAASAGFGWLANNAIARSENGYAQAASVFSIITALTSLLYSSGVL